MTDPMAEFLAGLSAFLLLLSLAAAIIDRLESEERRDARRRNPRPAHARPMR